jgi:DNA-binding NarL/FixJ family response regulator
MIDKPTFASLPYDVPAAARTPVRVLLADDHRMVRAGLAALIGAIAGFQVVAEASDGQEAVHLAQKWKPHVVLMDLSMPVLDGIAATRQIVAALPQTRVVMLTAIASVLRGDEALAAGAYAYLVKDCDPRTVVATVCAAARGDLHLAR